MLDQRRREADTLTNLKTEQAAIDAKVHALEIEAAPIMYVAALFGGTTEQAIRMLILLMVLTCDPLAIALTAAASARRRLRHENCGVRFRPQLSADLHATLRLCNVARLGCAIVGSRVAFGATSQVKEHANAENACTRPFDSVGGWDCARNDELCPSASCAFGDCWQRARWGCPAGPIRSRLRDGYRPDSLPNRARPRFRLGTTASL
jgi:hypothetical protein